MLHNSARYPSPSSRKVAISVYQAVSLTDSISSTQLRKNQPINLIAATLQSNPQN
ncbi:hypothetical protein [Bartonella rochalimae]|uniref:hypothetical protein n=1 Tax=Bartonella rochalimae TaxID=395923 RepID=UPI003F688385